MIYDDELDQDHAHTEITLSNTKLLMIFLGAAVVCGGCFGFGYSLGKHAGAIATSTPPIEAATPQTIVSSGNKPSAGSSGRTQPPSTAASDEVFAHTAAQEDPAETPASPIVERKPSPPPVVRNVAAKADTVPPVALPPTVAPGPHAYMVQVAAVSHKGDADILVSALRRKGYPVNEVAAPDNLIHVQVGPYATQKDAVDIKERLSSDGYLAIVKPPSQ